MTTLPGGIGQTYRLAAAELGFCAATKLFIRSLGGTAEAAESLREALGRDFPVLDTVAARWIAGERGDAIDPSPVVQALGGCGVIVVVGIEADHLDRLVDAHPTAKYRLLAQSPLPADWERVAANYAPVIQPVTLEDAFAHAGADSAVLCFAYGSKPDSLYVPPAWMRFFGRDVRPLFRSFVAWNVVPAPFEVYPRWLAACPIHEFTDVVVAR
jgi:hypothetical protein